MAKRLNSELKINNNFFTIKIGTTNKETPQVIYIEGRTFISPIEEKDCYEHDIRNLKLFLQKKINSILSNNELFETKYILDFQIANSGIRINKKSFLSFEFLIKQKNNPLLKLKDLKEKMADMIDDIMFSFKESIQKQGFYITKTKNVVIQNAVLLYK